MEGWRPKTLMEINLRMDRELVGKSQKNKKTTGSEQRASRGHVNALNLIKMASAVDVGSVERRHLRALGRPTGTWCTVGCEPKWVANVPDVR